MKKNKFLWTLALSSTCLFALASCQGAKGEKGDQGNPGTNGTNGTDGKNGEDGKNGSSVLTGKGIPASTLGSDGDSYIDSSTFDFYSKENGTWSKIGNIKGDTGSKGDDGEAGEKGNDGTSIHTGEGEPDESLGNDGDSYIDLSTFDFYVKENGEWSKEGNIKGDKGDKGDKGQTGSSGTSGTPGTSGKDGETAYSNVILYTPYGTITPSAGSVVANDENKISFTVSQTDYNEHRLTGLTFINPNLTEGEKTVSIDYTGEDFKVVSDNSITPSYTFTTTMLEGGFVVSANFSIKDKLVSIPDIDSGNGAIKVLNDKENKNKYFEGETVRLKFTFGTNKLIKSFKVNNSDLTFGSLTKSEDGSYYYYDATVGSDGVKVTDVVYDEGYVFEPISYNNGVVTISAAKENYYFIHGSFEFKVEISQTSSATLTSLVINGNDVTTEAKKGSFTLSNIQKRFDISCECLVEAKLLYKKYNNTDGEMEVSGRAANDTNTFINISSETVTGSNGSSGTVVSIGNYAFRDNDITSVYIPKNVINIGGGAFYGCNSLSKVTIEDGEGNLTIDTAAFMSCTSLKEITIPNRTKSIGKNAFNGCSGLKEITIPDNVTYLGETAFKGCTSLEKVFLGSKFMSSYIGIAPFGKDYDNGTITKSDVKIYYKGTLADANTNGWTNEYNLTKLGVNSTNFYYYSDTNQNLEAGKTYWHYDSITGEPTIWGTN